MGSGRQPRIGQLNGQKPPVYASAYAPREVAENAADAGGLISIPGHPPFKWKGLMLEQ